MKGKAMTKVKLPIILNDYLFGTDQFSHGELSESHLLNEAEWCYYNATQNPASVEYTEYRTQSKQALKRYIERLKDKGIEPKRDFD